VHFDQPRDKNCSHSVRQFRLVFACAVFSREQSAFFGLHMLCAVLCHLCYVLGIFKVNQIALWSLLDQAEIIEQSEFAKLVK